ncbi:MAG: hypothetical protein MJ151_01145 [Lachnospiraceae bacterium]|nr:hypothetical protein [Lachnospiraceae bacterium]
MWFYFNPSSNKKVRCDGDNATVGRDRDYTTKKINGHTYAFDVNGVMLTGWEAEPATRYYAENKVIEGQLVKKDWIFTIPPEGLHDNTDYNDQIERWFYASKSGNITKSIIKKINGKDYVFDNNGIMKSGLVIIDRNTREYVATIDIESTDGRDFLVDRKYVNKDTELIGYYHKENQILYYFKEDEWDDDFGARKLGDVKLAFSDKDYTFNSEKNGEKEGIKSKDKKYYQHGVLLLPDPFIGYGIVLEGYAYPATYPAGGDSGIQDQRVYDISDPTHFRAAVYHTEDATIADIVSEHDGNEYYVAYDDKRYGGDSAEHWAPYLKVVDKNGKRIKKSNVAKKDNNGNYWIIGDNGTFAKVVSVPVKYSTDGGWKYKSEIGLPSNDGVKSKTTYIPFGVSDIYGKTVKMKRQFDTDSSGDSGYDVELDIQYALNFSWAEEE